MNTYTMTERDLRNAAYNSDATEAERAEAKQALDARYKEIPEERRARRYSVALANTPKVGDGASFTIATDTKSCTVIKVSPTGKTVTLQEDHAELLNGMNSGEADALTMTPGGFVGHVEGRQRYQLTPNPTGPTFKVTLRNTGAWKVAGHPTRSPGCVAHFAGRFHHHDYNF